MKNYGVPCEEFDFDYLQMLVTTGKMALLFHNGLTEAETAKIVAGLRACGYRYVTLDLEGFRSGNLNQALS